MLGADPYWERIHLAYEFERRKRTKILHRHELSDTELQDGRVLEPGEIGYCFGSLGSAYYEFLTWRGYDLSRDELHGQQFSAWANTNFRIGKPCLVLRRLGQGKYVVCYLTTFGRAKTGTEIGSPMGRFFAISTGNTPRWPKHVPQLKVQENRYIERGYLFAVPVVRDNVMFHSSRLRPRLALGELERARLLVSEKVKAFHEVHTEMRKQQEQWRIKVQSMGGIGTVEFVPSHQETFPDQEVVAVPEEQLTIAEPPTLLEPEPPETPTGSPYRFKLPRVHYLESPRQWCNLRGPIRSMRQDIMHASDFLRRHPIARRIPKAVRWL